MVTISILLAICCGAASASQGRPLSRPNCRPLLALRGGYSSSRTSPRPVRYTYESGGVLEPMKPAEPAPSEQQAGDAASQMSDAEKVYVLQQFQKPAVRLQFVRKVYSIVFFQLLLTVGIIYALRTVPGLLYGILRRLGAGVGLLPLVPLLLLSAGGAASTPLSYALLAAFTGLEAIAVGAFTWAIPTVLMLQAAGATAVATGGLSLYALTTKRDFTMAGGMLFSSLLGVMSLGLLQFFLGPMPMLQTMRIALGLVVFCGYLVVNTQLMMGGNKKRQLRPTDHILAAVTLYTDIINIFLHILAAMSKGDRD